MWGGRKKIRRMTAQNTDQNDNRHDIRHEQHHAVRKITEKPEGKTGKNPRNEELQVHQEQKHESPEKKQVIDSEPFTDHTNLGKGINQHASESRPQMIEPVLPLSKTDDGEQAVQVPQKETHRSDQDKQKQQGFYTAQGNSFLSFQSIQILMTQLLQIPIGDPVTSSSPPGCAAFPHASENGPGNPDSRFLFYFPASLHGRASCPP